MDTEWFRARLRARGLSQRELAKLLGLDPSAISLALHGRRRISFEEAQGMADLLMVPISELLTHIGVTVPEGSRSVPVVGHVDAAGVHFTEQEAASVPGPGDLPGDAVALLVRGAGRDLRHFEGSVWFTLRPGKGVDAGECLGRLCIVQPAKTEGEPFAAYVGRGLRRNTYSLDRLGEWQEPEDVALAWAQPVLWIRT